MGECVKEQQLWMDHDVGAWLGHTGTPVLHWEGDWSGPVAQLTTQSQILGSPAL